MNIKNVIVGVEHPGPKWGLLDTADNLWLGNQKGPLLYTDETIARAAASIAGERLGQAFRVRAQRFESMTATFKDEITPEHSLDEALRKFST